MIIPDIVLEKQLWIKGYRHVAGVDEAGKGPWAGPVTAGAVIIHKENQIIKEVRDSKLMTKKQRELAYELIKKYSSSWGVGVVEPEEIDRIGIQKAVKKAMVLALRQAQANHGIDYIIVDGIKTLPITEYPSQRIKKGGLYHYSIAAGSVLAKVTRDRIMYKHAVKFPQYHFEEHVGYGTKKHLQALKEFGPCSIHRRTFKPVSSILYSKTVRPG